MNKIIKLIQLVKRHSTTLIIRMVSKKHIHKNIDLYNIVSTNYLLLIGEEKNVKSIVNLTFLTFLYKEMFGDRQGFFFLNKYSY